MADRTVHLLIRLLIRLHPPAFRERFGAELNTAWSDGWAASGTGLERLRFARRSAVGLLRSAVLEWWAPTVRHTGKGEGMTGGVWTDLRLSVRSLLRRPAYLSVATITIALGIGANTAIFSLIQGVLLAPLDYRGAEQLHVVGAGTEREPARFSRLSMPEIEGIRDLRGVEDAVGFQAVELVLTDMGQPARRIRGTRVTHPVLGLFQVAPRMGRDLTVEEATNVENDLIVLGHELWTRVFDGDPDILGRELTLDGGRVRVVGVGPEGFAYPADADFWVPGGRRQDRCWWGCNNFEVIARLAPSTTPVALRGELARLGEGLEAANPRTQTGRVLTARSLLAAQVGGVSRGLWVLMATVGVVLLIACANVANLMLVRGQTRRGEIAVRAALGAGRGRLIRSVLAEGAVLAGAGAVLGLVLASWVLDVLPRISAGAIPRLENVGLNLPVLGFALAATVLSTLLFALLPALQLARESISGVLRPAGRGSISSASARLRSTLLAGEVALSLVLLIGAGLLLRSFAEIAEVDPGYATRDVVRFDVRLPGFTYDEPSEVATYVTTLESELERIPGVRSAAAGMGTPLSSMSASTSVRVVDRAEPPPGEGVSAAMRAVSPGYFELLDIELLEGRTFDGTEQLGDTSSYVVNRTFAEDFLADRASAVGTPLRLGVNFGFNNIPGYVVGVVDDIRSTGITDEPVPEVYVAHAQYTPTFFTMNVRTEPGADVLPAIREAMVRVDPNVPLDAFGTIEQAIRAEGAAARFYLTLLGAFAGLALVMAAVGLYGVVSYLVTGRTREFGVRAAMGADRAGIVRLVLKDGIRPALTGLALGMLVALGAAHVLRSLLYGVEPLDPATFVVVPLLLLAVSFLALLAPARRATRVDPIEALRAD